MVMTACSRKANISASIPMVEEVTSLFLRLLGMVRSKHGRSWLPSPLPLALFFLNTYEP